MALPGEPLQQNAVHEKFDIEGDGPSSVAYIQYSKWLSVTQADQDPCPNTSPETTEANPDGEPDSMIGY